MDERGRIQTKAFVRGAEPEHDALALALRICALLEAAESTRERRQARALMLDVIELLRGPALR